MSASNATGTCFAAAGLVSAAGSGPPHRGFPSRLNTFFTPGGENPKAGGDGPRRLFTGGADMIGYLLFLLLIVVILGVKVKINIGPP
jgi:hypothetical protein